MWIICSSRCIVFHRPARSVSIAALSINSSSLPLPRRDEDRRNMGLRAAILVEIIVDAPAEGDDPEELAAGQRLAVFLRVERLDRAAKLGQVGADPGVAVDRLDRPVEEAVRSAGGFGDLLAAHRGQLDRPSCRIRGCCESSAASSSTNLATFWSSSLVSSLFSGTSPDASCDGDRLQRLGRVELELGRGRGRRSSGSLAMSIRLLFPLRAEGGRPADPAQEACTVL